MPERAIIVVLHNPEENESTLEEYMVQLRSVTDLVICITRVEIMQHHYKPRVHIWCREEYRNAVEVLLMQVKVVDQVL
jgi:hypothetical protein